MIAQIISYGIMTLILAAHFSRANNDMLAIVILLFPFLLLLKKAWVIDILQGLGALATLVWIYTGYQYVKIRLANGDDWIRLVLIIGSVALYTAWSTYFLRSKRVKEIYQITD